MKKIFLTIFAVLIAVTLFGQIAVKNREKIAFLGDSITWRGKNKTPYMGYILLVKEGLERCGIETTVIPAGVNGHKSNQMLARVEKDVIRKKPDWMLLSCGVNDVWMGVVCGVALPRYKNNIAKIVEKAQKAGIKVVIMTASMIEEDVRHRHNVKLKGYNDFLRKFAKEKNCLLADINAQMQKEVYSPLLADIRGYKLTCDGVHMNGRGNVMMASVILKTFGIPEEKVEKFRKEWEEKYVAARKNFSVGFHEELLLYKRAKDKGMKLEEYIKSVLFSEKK